MSDTRKTPPTAEQVEAVPYLRKRIACIISGNDHPWQEHWLMADQIIAALAPAERALTSEEQRIFHDALRASTTQRSPGYRKAPAERAEAVPRSLGVKEVEKDSDLFRRILAWWNANMAASQVSAVFITGDGAIKIWWRTADESSGYHIIPMRDLPTEAPTRAGALDAAGEDAYPDLTEAEWTKLAALVPEKRRRIISSIAPLIRAALAARDGDAK